MKCSVCKTDVESAKIYTIGKNKYCESCHDIQRETEKHRKQLIGYICEIFNVSKPTGMMFSQMKNFYEKDFINYLDQRLTLYYVLNIEKMPLDIKYGIGIVKFKHGDMLYYKNKIEQDKIKQQKESEKIEDIKIKPIEITINKSHKKLNYREEKMIKLEEWGF